MQCQNNFTSSYSLEQMRNAEISMEKSTHCQDIYIKTWQNHSFPIVFWKHYQGVAPGCDITHDIGDNFSLSSILLFLSSLHKNVFLWEQSDFEMEFDILLHEYHPFDCVL